MTVFDRCLILRCPFFCDLARERIAFRLPDPVKTALDRVVRRKLAFGPKALLHVDVLHDLRVRMADEEIFADDFVSKLRTASSSTGFTMSPRA